MYLLKRLLWVLFDISKSLPKALRDQRRQGDHRKVSLSRETQAKMRLMGVGDKLEASQAQSTPARPRGRGGPAQVP